MICSTFGDESTTCGACRKLGAGCSDDAECCGYKFGDNSKPFCVSHTCGHCLPKGRTCTDDSAMCDGYCCSGRSKQVTRHGETVNVCD